MIKFELYSNTADVPPTPVSIHYSSFLVGNTSRCQLKLNSQKRNFPILKCTSKEAKVTLETTNGLPFFLNGKKVLGLATIQVNDIIKLEDLSIKVLGIQLDIQCDELNHETLYDDFYQNNEEYESILGAIEKELIYSTDDLTSNKRS